MRDLASQIAILGYVTGVEPTSASFEVTLRSGDAINAIVEPTTWVETIRNLDLYDRGRTPVPQGFDASDPRDLVRRHIRLGRLYVVEGVYQPTRDPSQFFARRIVVLTDDDGVHLSERRHWWLTQIRELGDVWLRYLNMRPGDFDFSKYRTNLDISGMPLGGEAIQESATLSRLIYGLSSAYQLTGSSRFLDAARAGVAYQLQRFKSPTDDGHGVIWAHALVANHQVITSTSGDDRDTIPLYEQIYAISGLTQYYRITGDPEVLYELKRTIHVFNHLFHDPPSNGVEELPDDGEGDRQGYFSHIDYATKSPHSWSLGDNQSRKNWNSVGDHLPAYLINLLLALDPLPPNLEDTETRRFVETLRRILEETATLILEKMPEPDDPTYFVRERFFADWRPDLSWRWQQNRAIVGHDFKIAWNLTRVAIYHHNRGEHDHAIRFFGFAARLCRRMLDLGLDPIRGGAWDAVEREQDPARRSDPPRFAWYPTKDFWQQEQAILACLIIYGFGKLLAVERPEAWPEVGVAEPPEIFLEFARETMAFWNVHFLDRDDRGVFFRTTADGLPYLLGLYRNRGGHAISGYHVFELNYLAHVYISAFVRQAGTLAVRFRVDPHSGQRSLNVLPDFLPHELIEIEQVRIAGQLKPDHTYDPKGFRIHLDDGDLGEEVLVEFSITRAW